MKITRKREILIERERKITIKFGNHAAAEKLCDGCRERTQFITIDEAAVVRQMSARQIFRLVECGSIHFDETEGGKLLVCLESLVNTENETI